MEILIFAMRGSGAEPVAKWVANHFDNHTLHLQVRATPDGRLSCPDRRGTTLFSVGERPEENTLAVVWDAPLFAYDGPCVLMLEDVLTTFSGRLVAQRADPVLYNLDPIVRGRWNEYATEFVLPKLLPNAVRLNIERFRTSWEYREDIERALHLAVGRTWVGATRAPHGIDRFHP